MRRARYYAIAIILSIGTMVYGLHLIMYGRNVISGLDLLPIYDDILVGAIMISLGVAKVFSLYLKPIFLKKWALIGMMICWSVITWAYFKNDISNFGYIMSATLTLICGAELYRGDFSDV